MTRQPDPFEMRIDIEGQIVQILLAPVEFEEDPGVFFYTAVVKNTPIINGVVIWEGSATSYHGKDDPPEVAFGRLERALRNAVENRRSVTEDFVSVRISLL